LKLLEAFKNQVKSVGKVQSVWLTTFSLNIEFVETYILATVLGEEVPKSVMDFEGLQQQLVKEGIDFRVFFDKRMFDTPERKRTTIHMHGISGSRLEKFEKDALFHPKVIYIQGSDGAVLGAGSANLTMSGWARNQEVFSFRKIETERNFKQVQSFFSPLTDKKLKKLAYVKESVPWDFVHSFQGKSFLERLFDGHEESELSVWSPYFPKDLGSFHKKIAAKAKYENLILNIVPDKGDGKIRTLWPFSENTSHAEKIRFFENPSNVHQDTELVHAKVWKTKHKLAIGSWNFTHKGSNLEDSNIEAGFVFDDKAPVVDILGKPMEVSENDFFTEKGLEEVSLEVPKELPFDVDVIFDWEQRRYSVKCKAGVPAEGIYFLRLPDVIDKIDVASLANNEGFDLVLGEVQHLYLLHTYDIYKDEEVVYTGFITENKPASRPSQKYEYLFDLIDDLLIGGKANNVISHAEALSNHESGQHLSTQMDATNSMSYFRFFKAMKVYEQKINQMKKKSFIDEVFVRPGCLEELGLKVKEQLSKKSEEETVSKVFQWFMSQEVRKLINVARGKASELGIELDEKRWVAIEPTTVELELTGKQKRYLTSVIKGAGYE